MPLYVPFGCPAAVSDRISRSTRSWRYPSAAAAPARHARPNGASDDDRDCPLGRRLSLKQERADWRYRECSDHLSELTGKNFRQPAASPRSVLIQDARGLIVGYPCVHFAWKDAIEDDRGERMLNRAELGVA